MADHAVLSSYTMNKMREKRRRVIKIMIELSKLKALTTSDAFLYNPLQGIIDHELRELVKMT